MGTEPETEPTSQLMVAAVALATWTEIAEVFGPPQVSGKPSHSSMIVSGFLVISPITGAGAAVVVVVGAVLVVGAGAVVVVVDGTVVVVVVVVVVVSPSGRVVVVVVVVVVSSAEASRSKRPTSSAHGATGTSRSRSGSTYSRCTQTRASRLWGSRISSQFPDSSTPVTRTRSPSWTSPASAVAGHR